MDHCLEYADLGEDECIALHLVAVAILFPSEAIVDALAFLARRLGTFLVLFEPSSLLALLIIFQSSKVRVEGTVNALGDILQEVCVNGAEFGVSPLPRRDLLFLLILGGRYTMHFVTELSVVQKAVVEPAAHVEGRLQFCLLRPGRVEAVFEADPAHT